MNTLMVWKITGDFTNENLTDFINKIKGRFKLIYRSDTLYITVKNYRSELQFSDLNDIDTRETKQDMIERLNDELKNKIFIPLGDYWIKCIDEENNWSKEDAFTQEWVKENLTRLDKERLEIEQQSKLKEMWNDLDKLESELEERYKERMEEIKNKENDAIKKQNQKIKEDT